MRYLIALYVAKEDKITDIVLVRVSLFFPSEVIVKVLFSNIIHTVILVNGLWPGYYIKANVLLKTQLGLQDIHTIPTNPSS